MHGRMAPAGLTRMRPFPEVVTLPAAELVLDPERQTGRWLSPEGIEALVMDRHKRSETSKETAKKTSLDGTPDQGSDQEGTPIDRGGARRGGLPGR